MRKYITYIFILLPILWSVESFAACGGSSPNWTATNLADVAACQAEAGFNPGDTITVSGNSTPTAGITITKAMNLMGSGTPVITRGEGVGNNGSLITVTLATDVVVRISGFTFDNTTTAETDKHAIYITGKTDNSLVLSKIVIDSNTFLGGKRAVFNGGVVYGVIRGNQFTNCDIAIAPRGDGDHAWTRWGADQSAGTANALIIEGNTFTLNASNTGTNEQIYHQEGAKTVIRYNTFDATAYEAGVANFIDSHGNWGGDDHLDYRGQPLVEIYNNSVHVYAATFFAYIRGGSVIAHHNAFTVDSGSALFFRLTDEEDWSSSACSPSNGTLFAACDTEWPTEDQINNSYFYANTYNGSLISDGSDVSLKYGTDSTFIQSGRDYWTAAPAASGGSESYTTRTNTMTFSAEGANKYNPYTIATCPDTRTGLTGSCTSGVGTTGYNVATAHTVTSSKIGTGTLSYEGEYVVTDGADSPTYTATIPNGWKVTWSGTGGCTGNGTTCQVLNVTADKTVIATFSEIKLMPW